MLVIDVDARNEWDPKIEEFITIPKIHLQLEHSLISVSKWESKWHVPFLADREKSGEELIDYIKCMSTISNVDLECYNHLPAWAIEKIVKYIEDPMTATWITPSSNTKTKEIEKEIITSEIIYYWMISLNIPIEMEKWHLKRLLMLIQVVSIKSSPPKKMSKKEIAQQNMALNEARLSKIKHKV